MDEGPARLRVGVAGVGSLGYHHARILADMAGVEMVGFFDATPDRAAFVSAELELVAHDSLDQLLGAVDALVIAVPTTDHESVALAALGAEVHVLIEKPMAPSLDAADRILQAAERADRLVQVGHIERFNAAILAAMPYLGEPLFIESHRMAPFGSRGTDVAVVLDLMIHDVDLVGSLVGTEIRDIAASGVPILSNSIDIANARLGFEGGAVANLTASRVSLEKMRKLRIFQRSGYLSLDLARGTGSYLRLKGDLPVMSGEEASSTPLSSLLDIVERIPLQGNDTEPLRRELESFRDVILEEREPIVSGEAGRAALAVSLSIEDRIRQHVVDTRPA
jgi:predicted dehydrogenase